MSDQKVKILEKYNRIGVPHYVNERGIKVCCYEGCYEETYSSRFCVDHRKSLTDKEQKDYINSIKVPINNYIKVGNYYELAVRNDDRVFLIDEQDFETAKKHNWRSSRPTEEHTYLITNMKIGETPRKFHRVITDKEVKMIKDKKAIIDHINGNTRDNRRNNLRIRTYSENNMNKNIQSNNSSGIVGVKWSDKDRLWYASITAYKKKINLGGYYYLRNAVKERVDAENKYFGEHAFKEREDSKYKMYLESIMRLPLKKEPYLINNKKSDGLPLGIRNYNDKFLVRVLKDNKKPITKTFSNLIDAKKWQENTIRKYHRKDVIYLDQRKDREI